MLITVEGGEGSGKSTIVRILANRLEQQGFHVVPLREPGGTDLGEAVRKVVLDGPKDIHPRAELLLFLSARAQLVERIIRPALAVPGTIVIIDRFVDSSVAYQGARGLQVHEIEAFNEWILDGIEINLTLYLDIDPREGLRRRAKDRNRIDNESVEFHERVRQGYLALAKRHPRIRVVDARRDLPEVIEEVWDIVASALEHKLSHNRTPVAASR